MAYCLKKPKPICSAYEETELVLQTDKGLYKWAQAHQNDTEGVNILPLKTSNADVEMPVGSSAIPAGQRQLPTLFSRIETSGLTRISTGGVSAIIPFTIGKYYSLGINKLSIKTSTTNNNFAGGRVELIIDQTFGDALWTLNTTPSRNFVDYIERAYINANQLSTVGYPDMQAALCTQFIVQNPFKDVTEAWTGPGLTAWFNFRHCIGVPQSFDCTNRPLGYVEVSQIMRNSNSLGIELVFNIDNIANDDLVHPLVIYEDKLSQAVDVIGFKNGKLVRLQDSSTTIDVVLKTLNHIVIWTDTTAVTSGGTGIMRIDFNGTTIYNGDVSYNVYSNIKNIWLGGSADGSLYMGGHIYYVRTLNTIWNITYVQRNMYYDGKMLDTIIPYALTSRFEVRSIYRYGYTGDFQPWFYSGETTMRSSVSDGSSQAILIPYDNSFLVDYKTPESPGASPNGFLLMSVTAGKIMINTGNDYLPYLPSPADLLNSLSPTDTTLPMITVNVERPNANTQNVLLSSEPDKDGKIKYDLGWIFKSSFFNIRSGYSDNNLYGNYTVNNIPGEDTAQENARRLFMRHISQYGHISDMQTENAAMLMSPACWVWYEGYPLDMVINTNTFSIGPYLYGKTFNSAYKAQQIPVGVSMVDLTDTESWELRNSYISFQYFTPKYHCRLGCIPDNPFYIRWINEKGGYDFWMFKSYPSDEQEIEDIINILPYPSDQYRIWHRASAIGRKRITVGDGLLTREEFECLKFIPRSPLVEWYDESIGKWQTVVFEDSISVTWNSRSGLGDIEYTFTLPPIKLQQL
jgi:hypothetical protein